MQSLVYNPLAMKHSFVPVSSVPIPLPHSSSHSHSSHSHSHHSKDKGNKRKAQRVQRACSNCRKRKQGCETERPCRRCVEKGIDCTEVEPKRKRGRNKSGEPAGTRARTGSQDEFFEDEDEMEDSFESSEEDSSSEEDQSNAISPREASSNTASSTNANGMTSHIFKLNGSNTSTGSNLHSSPFVSNHSISISNSNSNVHSLSSSQSSVPTLNAREFRSRSSSVSSIPPDSPNPGNDEAEADLDLLPTDQMRDDIPFEFNPSSGLNLSLLLPFIGNLCVNEEVNPVPMYMDDNYGSFLESDPASTKSLQINTTSSESMAFHNKIWNSDLPFFTSAASSLPKGINVEDGDTHAQTYIKDCWDEFQTRSKFQAMDSDLQRANESWKEILRCLRQLDWLKVQQLLQEAESSPFNQYFGMQTKPSVVFWSSGGRIHHANDSFCKMVGYSVDELRADVSMDMRVGYPALPEQKIRAHSFFHPEEMMKIMKRQLEAVQNPEKSSFSMNTRLLSKYRHEIPVSCSILNLRDTLGMSLLTVAIFV